jgi:ABC-2 type transport system ATP-binding protein
MSAAAIETSNLRKTYRTFRRDTVPALESVSVRVESGTIFGLIGQNGAGKTTLVKILLGLTKPSGGSASLLGGSPRDPKIRRRIGYLPEHMRLPDYFKAESFLRYMAELNRVDSDALRNRIPNLIDRVGLGGVDRPVKAYSKGMQQRLGLAQALVNDPDILFLDEPTDGLDPLGRKDVRDLLVSLRSEGKTIFLNSHLLSEIEMVCDRIVILNKGQVARAAMPSEFTSGTGEYHLRVGRMDDRVQAAARSVLGTPESSGDWQGRTLRFRPRDIAHLNALIDRIRCVPAEIEAIEPIQLTLEEFFLQVVSGERAC